jgi:hypothetical protein
MLERAVFALALAIVDCFDALGREKRPEPEAFRQTIRSRIRSGFG